MPREYTKMDVRQTIMDARRTTFRNLMTGKQYFNYSTKFSFKTLCYQSSDGYTVVHVHLNMNF